MTNITTSSGQTIRVVDASGGGSLSIASTLINCYSALSIPAYKRAVTFIAENLSSFPRSVRRNGAKVRADSHPLDTLLKRRPNGYQNATTFWRTLYFHAAHTGNGYARIERGTAPHARALHNLLPEDVRPFRYDRGDGTGLQQFYFHTTSKTVIHGADMLHLQSIGHDGMVGSDNVSLHERTFQRAATLEKFQTTYLQRGTVIRGSLEIPGEMTDEQLAQIKAELKKYRGADGEDDVLVVGGGGKLTNTTTSPQQSQLVEQMAAITKQVSQVTGVPPDFLFELSEAKYNAIVEQGGQFIVRYCFRPWIEMAEDELTAKLLTEVEQDQGYTVHINPDALLRGSGKEQMEVVAKGVDAGIYTKNEAREFLGKARIDDPEADKLKPRGDTAPAAQSAEDRTADGKS